MTCDKCGGGCCCSDELYLDQDAPARYEMKCRDCGAIQSYCPTAEELRHVTERARNSSGMVADEGHE
jgi:hypothetical protein